MLLYGGANPQPRLWGPRLGGDGWSRGSTWPWHKTSAFSPSFYGFSPTNSRGRREKNAVLYQMGVNLEGTGQIIP